MSILNVHEYDGITQVKKQPSAKTKTSKTSSDFEKAVQLIKKYEGLHQPKHWPLVGYGHLVQKGEKFNRSKAMSEKEAEELLRKDLLKNCAKFRSFGPDSLILGVLAYNIGSGATMKSSVYKKLKAGDRNIYDSYVAHSRYKGKVHPQIKQRRIEEYNTLFLKSVSDMPEIDKIDEKIDFTAMVNIHYKRPSISTLT